MSSLVVPGTMAPTLARSRGISTIGDRTRTTIVVSAPIIASNPEIPQRKNWKL